MSQRGWNHQLENYSLQKLEKQWFTTPLLITTPWKFLTMGRDSASRCMTCKRWLPRWVKNRFGKVSGGLVGTATWVCRKKRRFFDDVYTRTLIFVCFFVCMKWTYVWLVYLFFLTLPCLRGGFLCFYHFALGFSRWFDPFLVNHPRHMRGRSLRPRVPFLFK